MAESSVPVTSLSKGSEPVFDVVCSPCNSEGKIAEAEGYCQDCCEHLCRQCIGFHKKFSMSKHHKLLDKQNMPETPGTPQVEDVCTERCQIHKGEIIKYFCPIHKVLGCNVCVTLKHSRCEDVGYIPEIVPGLEDSRDFNEFMAKLDGLTQKSKDNAKFAEEGKKQASDCHQKANENIDAFRKDIMDVVDKQVKELKDRARQIHIQDTGKMNSLADDSNKVLAELQSMSSDLGSLRDKKQFCQMFVEIKNKRERLAELQDKLEDMTGNDVSDYTFQPDQQVPTMIRRQNGLGQLVMKASEKPGSPLKGKSASPPKGDTGSLPQATPGAQPQNNSGPVLQGNKADGKKPSVKNLQQMKATHVADISVKSTQNDFKCYIRGVALLSTERLVAADCNIGTIKLIDIPNKKIISEFRLEKAPWDVAVCRGEVAATLPRASKIVFLNCDNGLVLVRDVRVGGQCRGIDCADGKLFVIYDTEKKLEIMTVTGTVLQKVERDDRGGQLFKDPCYVTVSSANQSIYVSEWGEGQVTVLGLDGKVKGEYRDDQLGQPRQLAADSAGVTYLCDYDNHTIHLLSPQCQKVKVLLTGQDGLNGPQSVCYCENTGRLFIGMVGDTLEVYQVTKSSTYSKILSKLKK